MRFHWQNLNEKPGRRLGWGGRHGRCWLTFLDREGTPSRRTAGGRLVRGTAREGIKIAVEWSLGKPLCHVSVGLVKSEEQGAKLSLALPLLFSLHVLVSGGPLAALARRLLPKWTFELGEDRGFEFRIFSWAIWWDVWRDPMAGWSKKTPRWRSGCWHPLDTFLGKARYSSRPFVTMRTVVPMPERSYACDVTISEDTWRRPLWFPKRVVRASVDMVKGDQIPVPGKGTAEYNCGENALYGLSCQATSVSAAVGSVVESVTRSRLRYGGEGWQPEAVRKAAKG